MGVGVQMPRGHSQKPPTPGNGATPQLRGAAEAQAPSAAQLFIYFQPRYMTVLLLRRWQQQKAHHTASLLKAEPGNQSLICIFIST